MKPPKKILKIWKDCIDETEIKLVTEEYGLGVNTIYNVFKTGRCDKETFEKLNSFVLKHKAEKKNLIEKLEA